MNLREALNLCTDIHSDDWVEIPSGQWGRPATAMVAGMFDPGFEKAQTRPLMGHSLAVYEPDARLSLVWPIPEDDEADRRGDDYMPEWLDADGHQWKSARPGWVVVMLSGTPIWQALLWYLNWGSGIGGYVPNITARFGENDDQGVPTVEAWETSEWAVGLARLINSFTPSSGFNKFDPTTCIVPNPLAIHPVDLARGTW